MRKLYVLLSITCILLFSGCQSDYDIPMYGDIYVAVTDYETNELLEDVTVQLLPANEPEKRTIGGVCIFEELAIQQYTIVVKKVGYKVNRKIVNTVRGETIQVEISMEKIKQ